MRGFLDLRVLWLFGAANVIFSGVGIFAVGSIIGFPLYLAALAMGIPLETVLTWLLYSAPLWVPIGAGAGWGGAAALTRGIKRPEPKQAEGKTQP